MRKMNKVGLVVLGITAFAGISRPVLAAPDAAKTHEGGKHKGRGHKDAGRHIAAELNLTDVQKAQLKAIRQEARAARGAIRGNADLTREQKRAQMKELHASTKAKISAILTPEQRAKLEALHAKRKAERKERRGEKRQDRKDRKDG